MNLLPRTTVMVAPTVIPARALAAECALTVVINVRNPHGGSTYIARAQGFGTTASSTADWLTAATRCAAKLAKDRPFTLKRVTNQTYLCEIQEAA